MSDSLVRRVTGVSGLLVLPLIAIGFGVIVGVSPTVEDDRAEIATYYEELSFGRAMVGEWLELLAFAALIVFAAGLARLLDGHPDRWLGWAALAAAAALGASVVTGVAPLVAAAYLGDHGGIAQDHYVALNAVRSAAHWLSTVFAGTWMLATAVAVLRAGVLRRWLGWAALVIAALLILGVAAPLEGGVDLGQMLMALWLFVTGALLTFGRDRGRTRSAVTA